MTNWPHVFRKYCFALSLGITLAGFRQVRWQRLISATSRARDGRCACVHGQGPPGVSTNVHRATTAEGWWSYVANGDCAQVSSIHAGGHWLYIREKSRSEVVKEMQCFVSLISLLPISRQFKRAGDTVGAISTSPGSSGWTWKRTRKTSGSRSNR